MSTEMVALLQRIAGSLERIETLLSQGAPAGGRAAPAGRPASASSGPLEGEIATDEDLDGKYGDPDIRRDPPRWSGESYAGKRYSESSPEFLECIAGFLDWAAGQAESKNELTGGGQPRAPFLRRDAARARGWRARLLGGGAQPARQEAPRQRQDPMPSGPAPEEFVGDDDIPF
jgi:hypothetical protein